jgi:DhnA family fructose-bisphosphate aldolase class Ia
MILSKLPRLPSSTSAPAGQGLISGRKAFQRPMEEGVKILNTIQDVYLDESILAT